ncbi:pyrroloquinoline quinone biosynthesis protein PqqB [Nonomuraea jiangxiensis]|uniref:Coenzyme PQQ synthesis protein B n=1 Tax=Nonomuraea jiangxiensis TaxID=633440 RepID=A0A1G9G2X9_9ACTN|nr:MBL fold metallo-hydrolase [Nonomuraea jiangxiensis]SDK95018.1 pyrroloquinoline quinone biosynthesis protein B [Nonomuraea jiangxiensis]
MRVQVLGTAAGGGLPQWNCACPGCRSARAHPARRRRHASLAIEVEPGRVYLVNATPDVGEQIESCPWLRPVGRTSPLAGVILTDAELDHTLGLARLREADELEVVATEPVRQAVGGTMAMLEPYVKLVWRTFADLGARAIPISGKRPRYASGHLARPDGAWVSALELRGLLYAPCMARWPEGFGAAADVVFADGTFFTEQEPLAFSARTATEMGHLPIEATRERLSALSARCLYTHLNNTNPLADPASPWHAGLGVEVAYDGMVIDL